MHSCRIDFEHNHEKEKEEYSMIRTNTVELTVIPAIAYRTKLTSGGSGIVILRDKASQPGVAAISKTSGKAIPAANLPADLYPEEAFAEAIKLTAGLPYKKQGPARAGKKGVGEEKAAVPEDNGTEEEKVAVSGEDYQAVFAAYQDKNGKFSYLLLNRDLMRFARRSSVAREMIQEGKSVEKIRLYLCGAKFRSITGNKKLTDKEASVIASLLDELEPKGIFKELNSDLRKQLREAKK